MTVLSRRALAGGLAAVVVAAGGFGPAVAADKELKWGSSSIGSTGYVIIEALANTVNRHTDIRNSALATAGGAENMVLIGDGRLDLGQTTSSDWAPATQGKPPFRKPVDVQQMLSYTVWNAPTVVPADSPIRSVDDLAGRRLMPSQAGSATAVMYKVLMEAAGIGDKVRWNYGSWTDTYNALKSGGTDAAVAILTNGRPSPQITEVQSAIKIRVVPYPEEALKKARAMNPGIMRGEVTPAQWNALAEPMMIPSFAGILAVRPDVDETAAYKIVKAIYDNAEEVRKVGIQLQDIRPEFATKYLLEDYPVHPGAARYFKEKGLWRDELKIGTR